MSTKLAWAQNAQALDTELALLKDKLADSVSAYFSRVYNTGGTAIVDADVSSLGITAANISSYITMSQQLANFFGNLAVTQGAYQTTLDQMRTDT